MAIVGRLSIWALVSFLCLNYGRAEGSSYRLTAAAAFVSHESSRFVVTRNGREEQRGCGRSVLPKTTTTMIRASQKDDNFRDQDIIIAFREEQKRSALVEALMGTPTTPTTSSSAASSSSSLLSTEVVGRTTLPMGDNNTSVSCVLLAPRSPPKIFADPSSTPCLLVPLSSESPGAMKLLSFAFKNRPVSKSVLITSLNPLLVNRDNGLFDNLPWSTWTVDPAKRNRDAANNLIMPKFHMGKRDAYQRFLGKDWPGRSLAIGNLALRLQYSLEADTSEQVPNDEYDERENELKDESSFSAESMTALAQRILELQLRDLNMELAEWDYQLALARANAEFSSMREVQELERQRQLTFDQLQQGQDKLQQLVRGAKSTRSSRSSTLDEIASQRQIEPLSSSSASTVLGKVLEDVALWTTNYGQNAAPYRGAMGYAPLLDSRRQVDATYLPTYTSPYDVMKDIIGDQLNAECIGVVLENTSFFQLTLGGAIILQRKTATQTKTILGEKVSVRDEEEDFGNPGVGGGETVLVECSADEAIGMALAYGLPVRVPTDIWEQANLLATPSDAVITNSSNVFDAIPLWEPLDTNLTFLKEGQARNTTKATASPLRIPKTTSSLWDSLWDNGKSRPSEGLFPTDNPIQSLSEYDELSNQDKARVLLSLSNFQGRLPRPRVVRQAEESASTNNRQAGGGGSPLDKLLLPLIDESVRRQYLMRDAERRGDRDMLQQLQETKSMRQVAKERAETAAQTGEDAEYWQAEADFYASLRADVTQDEGSYNRFLDRDEWYERNRQAQAKRVNKKLFGTLLDGIE